MTRSNIKLLTSWITGHCKLNKHLAYMKLSNNPKCQFCNEHDETPTHFIKDCLYLEKNRYNFLLLNNKGDEDFYKKSLSKWEFRKKNLTIEKISLIMYLYKKLELRLTNDDALP